MKNPARGSAIPIQHDMIECNGTKTFLFDLKRHQNRRLLGLRPKTPLDGGTHRVLHTFLRGWRREER